MSRTRKLVSSMASVLVAALFLSVSFSPQAATAEDLPKSSSCYSPDIFSQVMSDLEQIKEMAFADSFFASEESSEDSSPCCGCNHCDRTAKVCTHLAHPESSTDSLSLTDSLRLIDSLSSTDLLSECGSHAATDPLACSHEVRGTDVIPPVPNIEDYATPDEFVDEDMINKLQPDEVTMETGIEKYCDRMATLLSDTLSSDTLDRSQKTAAIKSAMELAVINAQIAAEAKIAQVKATYETELAVMRSRLNQYSFIESNQHKLYQWLSPIYKNVDRNFQQMEKITEGSTELRRSLGMIQTQLQQEQTANGKNQLIVTKREEAKTSPPASRVSLKRIPNQFIRSSETEVDENSVSAIDFKILELRLQQTERLIGELTDQAAHSQAMLDNRSQQNSATQYVEPTTAAPTHRRASYDRLTPIAPLQPRR